MRFSAVGFRDEAPHIILACHMSRLILAPDTNVAPHKKSPASYLGDLIAWMIAMKWLAPYAFNKIRWAVKFYARKLTWRPHPILVSAPWWGYSVCHRNNLSRSSIQSWNPDMWIGKILCPPLMGLFCTVLSTLKVLNSESGYGKGIKLLFSIWIIIIIFFWQEVISGDYLLRPPVRTIVCYILRI